MQRPLCLPLPLCSGLSPPKTADPSLRPAATHKVGPSPSLSSHTGSPSRKDPCSLVHAPGPNPGKGPPPSSPSLSNQEIALLSATFHQRTITQPSSHLSSSNWQHAPASPAEKAERWFLFSPNHPFNPSKPYPPSSPTPTSHTLSCNFTSPCSTTPSTSNMPASYSAPHTPRPYSDHPPPTLDLDSPLPPSSPLERCMAQGHQAFTPSNVKLPPDPSPPYSLSKTLQILLTDWPLPLSKGQAHWASTYSADYHRLLTIVGRAKLHPAIHSFICESSQSMPGTPLRPHVPGVASQRPLNTSSSLPAQPSLLQQLAPNSSPNCSSHQPSGPLRSFLPG